jgi:Peptidase S46
VKKFLAALALGAFMAVCSPVRADEGMWTFDAFPSAKVAAEYGFTPSAAFLDHIRKSSLRIAGGCSASFVSPQGLVMTNHHCAVDCVEQLSTPEKNYVDNGFYAKTNEDEPKCPGFELDRLDSIDDVTATIRAATAQKTGRALIDAMQGAEAKLSSSCGTSEAVRCDVVSLYRGGVYKLYHYGRFTDVRLAFAPEFGVAQFGGDPDNFNFPRYDFDVTFLRAYVDGKPATTPDYLQWSPSGSKAGDLVFVSGNPGSTQRLLTVSQLAYIRDHQLPRLLPELSEYRGLLEQYQTEGPEQLRQTKDALFFLENDYKAQYGQEAALLDPAFFATKVAQESAFRAGVAKIPALQASIGGDWDKLAAVEQRRAALAARSNYVGQGIFFSDLFGYARTLVRYPAEKAKPNGERLPEFSDARLVTLPQQLLAPVPIYPGPEELGLNFWAKKMREDLGADDPFVKQVLGTKSPAQWAHDLVTGTKLADPAVRKALFDGGQAAIDASQDPMIVFAASIDAEARAVRKNYEDEVSAPESQLSEAIARARFAILGTSVDPDATFTARLSYGAVKGFVDGNGNAVAPYTTIGGLFNRGTGSDPYILPPAWLAAKGSLDLSTPMNLTTTNDIIGGNSGSPLIDKNGAVVGLIFDGNIFSLGGAYGYDPRVNRSVAVDSRALMAGLRTVYHADRLVTEIGAGSP